MYLVVGLFESVVGTVTHKYVLFPLPNFRKHKPRKGHKKEEGMDGGREEGKMKEGRENYWVFRLLVAD